MRGLAIFNTRRVSKFTQEELLGRYLPSAIRFIGAFDKSGNYALTTRVSQDEAAQAIVDALTHDERLADLTRSHVSVVLVSELVLALEGLIQSVTALHGDRFDPRSFEVRIATARWRAGITFLPEPPAVRPFVWPALGEPKVEVLASSGRIAKFLKREEQEGEERISFGDPTRAVDAALATHLGRTISSTSRSGRTIRGVLRQFDET